MYTSLMTIDPGALYIQLGRLVESMPHLEVGPITPEVQQWLGRAGALIEAMGDAADIVQMKVSSANLNSSIRGTNAQTIKSIVYRALATAELNAPASAQGAFIPAGNAFDAYAAIGKVLSIAGTDLLIVDPYMDEKALTEFAVLAHEQVSVRLLSDEHSHKPTLGPAAQRWAAQYGGKRPLQVRLTPPRRLHDRLIVVDGKVAWTLTQSLNAFAARAPASLVRVDPETAALKIAAYGALWNEAKPL